MTEPSAQSTASTQASAKAQTTKTQPPSATLPNLAPPNPNALASMSIIAHLQDLRQRLIRMFVVVLLIFFALLPFADQLYEMLSAPLRALLPSDSSMIATDVTATFMAPFKLNAFVAVILAMPYLLYQVWGFIAPALYQRERHIAIPLVVSSFVLFYVGIACAFFVTLPAVLSFFIHATPDSVAPMTDINSYLSFCLKLFLVFGLTFEVPIATLILILTGLISTQDLAAKRRYIIVGCFTIAMFVTPPDALSMALLATIMWLLFECGLFFGRMLEKKTVQP